MDIVSAVQKTLLSLTSIALPGYTRPPIIEGATNMWVFLKSTIFYWEALLFGLLSKNATLNFKILVAKRKIIAALVFFSKAFFVAVKTFRHLQRALMFVITLLPNILHVSYLYSLVVFRITIVLVTQVVASTRVDPLLRASLYLYSRAA